MIYNPTNYDEIHKEIPGQCWKCKDRSYKICDLSHQSCTITAPICKATAKGNHILLSSSEVLFNAKN